MWFICRCRRYFWSNQFFVVWFLVLFCLNDLNIILLFLVDFNFLFFFFQIFANFWHLIALNWSQWFWKPILKLNLSLLLFHFSSFSLSFSFQILHFNLIRNAERINRVCETISHCWCDSYFVCTSLYSFLKANICRWADYKCCQIGFFLFVCCCLFQVKYSMWVYQFLFI